MDDNDDLSAKAGASCTSRAELSFAAWPGSCSCLSAKLSFDASVFPMASNGRRGVRDSTTEELRIQETERESPRLFWARKAEGLLQPTSNASAEASTGFCASVTNVKRRRRGPFAESALPNKSLCTQRKPATQKPTGFPCLTSRKRPKATSAAAARLRGSGGEHSLFKGRKQAAPRPTHPKPTYSKATEKLLAAFERNKSNLSKLQCAQGRTAHRTERTGKSASHIRGAGEKGRQSTHMAEKKGRLLV